MVNSAYIEQVGADAVLVRNIVKVKILGRGDRRKLEDKTRYIIASDIINGKRAIGMAELTKRYTHSSGRQIKPKYLKSGVAYPFVERASKKCKVLVIPDGESIEINGKDYDSENVIVLIDGRLRAVKASTFRKMFIIEDNASNIAKRIQKYKNGLTASAEIDRAIDFVETPVEKKESSIQKEVMEQMMSMSESLTAKRNRSDAEVASRNSGNKAVGAILDSNKKVIGYIIEDRAGKRHNVKYSTVVKMASEKKIDNIVVSKVNGKAVLKGFGIRLEGLPTYFK